MRAACPGRPSPFTVNFPSFTKPVTGTAPAILKKARLFMAISSSLTPASTKHLRVAMMPEQLPNVKLNTFGCTTAKSACPQTQTTISGIPARAPFGRDEFSFPQAIKGYILSGKRPMKKPS